MPHHVPYRELTACDEPFGKAIEWLRGGTALSAVYYHEPDKSGHAYGPFSPEVSGLEQEVDARCVMRSWLAGPFEV